MPRHSHQFFDSKGRSRGLVQRARQALGWSGRPEGVKSSVKAFGSTDDPECGRTGGNASGFTAGETYGSEAVVHGGNSPGNAGVVQSGEQSGVELHVVDGRLIACRPGEPPPLGVHQHAQAFLDWLKAHDKVPGNEVPVAIMENVLYWDFLRETGLPTKPWRAVSDNLARLPGVKKYQADWRDSGG